MDSELGATSAPETTATEKPARIWVLHIPFNKQGAPVVGNFGRTIAPVVIMPMATWTRLCQQIPELGRMQFEVGSED